MLAYLVRRLLLGIVVIVATAVFAYGGIRFLRPELHPGEGWLAGTWSDVTRALLHLDFGESCMYAGCPKLHDLWLRGLVPDVSLLAGGILLGVAGGLAAGKWCAAHPRSRSRRALEAFAMFGYCAPPYVVAFGALLLFDPAFGLAPLKPFFVEVQGEARPFDGLLETLRLMAVPWLLVSWPVAAACMRITLAMTSEAAGEDYMRTALAKGLTWRTAVRRHAGPSAHATVASYIGSVVPAIVLNVVLIEFVLSVPGFFRHTWKAFGKAFGVPSKADTAAIDYPTLQAIGLWAAVLIVVVGLLADLALAAVDPRIRARGRVG